MNEQTARRLIRAASRAALATLFAGKEEAPYVSLVTVATEHDGSPILLLSTLADHTRNIAADPRVSLLFEDIPQQANPQQTPRVTLMGRAVRASDPAYRTRFLARHPEAALYADFADFGFFRVEIERAHFVGGFARAVWLNPVLAPSTDAMAKAEADLLQHLNTDHADTLALCALRAALPKSAEDAGWRAAALDVDGIDLYRLDIPGRVFRIAFTTPLTTPDAVLPALRALK